MLLFSFPGWPHRIVVLLYYIEARIGVSFAPQDLGIRHAVQFGQEHFPTLFASTSFERCSQGHRSWVRIRSSTRSRLCTRALKWVFISWVPNVWTQHHFVPVPRHFCSVVPKCERGLRATLGSRGFSLSESWGRGFASPPVPRCPWFRPQLSESEKPLEPKLCKSELDKPPFTPPPYPNTPVSAVSLVPAASSHITPSWSQKTVVESLTNWLLARDLTAMHPCFQVKLVFQTNVVGPEGVLRARREKDHRASGRGTSDETVCVPR